MLREVRVEREEREPDDGPWGRAFSHHAHARLVLAAARERWRLVHRQHVHGDRLLVVQSAHIRRPHANPRRHPTRLLVVQRRARRHAELTGGGVDFNLTATAHRRKRHHVARVAVPRRDRAARDDSAGGGRFGHRPGGARFASHDDRCLVDVFHNDPLKHPGPREQWPPHSCPVEVSAYRGPRRHHPRHRGRRCRGAPPGKGPRAVAVARIVLRARIERKGGVRPGGGRVAGVVLDELQLHRVPGKELITFLWLKFGSSV